MRGHANYVWLLTHRKDKVDQATAKAAKHLQMLKINKDNPQGFDQPNDQRKRLMEYGYV